MLATHRNLRRAAAWLLLMLPASLATAAPRRARLDPEVLPTSLRKAQLTRHQHYLQEAFATRLAPTAAPTGNYLPLAFPVLNYKVPTLDATLAFDFDAKRVTVGMNIKVVSSVPGVSEILLVAAEELTGSEMAVSDALGALSVVNVGNSVRVVRLRAPLDTGESVDLTVSWQGETDCQGYCQISPSITFNVYTSWLPFIYDYRLDTGIVVYPAVATLTMTIPAGMVAACSGELLNSQTNSDGTITVKFQDTRFGRFGIGIAPYTMESTAGQPLIRSYLREPVAALGAGWREAARDIIAFHTQSFGSYDFSKADLVEVSDFLISAGAGGVAGLSMIFIPSSEFAKDPSDWRNRQTVAHELAHQWHAMMIHNNEPGISPWLSEGFSTFAETEYSIAAAAKTGLSIGPVIRRMDGLVYQTTAGKNGDLPISSTKVREAADLNYVALTYYKGALVASMLKYLVGDEAFHEGIAILKRNHGDDATVDNLLASLKQASGKDLTGFASKWIRGTGYPTYTVTVTRAAGKPAEVVIDSGTDFGLPIELDVLTGDGKTTRRKITPVGAKATYTAESGDELLQINPDPDARILSRIVPALAGDVQISGEVDGIDLITEAWAVGQKYSLSDITNDPYFAAQFSVWADLVFDQVIDQQDLEQVLNSFGKTQS